LSVEQDVISLGVKTIRERGIGLNFDVLNQGDGFRGDNTVWHGNCSICKMHVSSTFHTKGLWMHTIDLEVTYHTNGDILSRKSKQIDYCPLGAIVLD